MAGIKAADLQYILNNISIEGWAKGYGLDETFLGVIGGFKKGRGRIQTKHHYAGNTTAGSFGEGDDLSTAGHQSRRRLNHSWRRVYVTFGADGLQEAIAANGGIDGIQDILKEEMTNGVKDLLDEINTQAMSDGSGNSAKDMDGIQFQIADDNTWGGLARGSYAWLQSYMNDNSGTPRDLTSTLLRDMHNTLTDTRKSKYDICLTSSAIWDAYEDLLGNAKRYMDVKVGDIFYKALLIKGKPLIAIPSYPTGRIEFLERKNVDLLYLPSPALEGRGKEGFFKVEKVANTSDDATFRIIAYVNLICKSPWTQGALADVQ